jgi:hypothetical protein
MNMITSYDELTNVKTQSRSEEIEYLPLTQEGKSSWASLQIGAIGSAIVFGIIMMILTARLV